MSAARHLRLGRRSRAITEIAGATAIAQALALLALPLLTRMYSPEAFGVYNYLFSLTLVLVMIATVRLELAIPLVHSLSEVKALVRLGLLTTLASSVALLVIVALLGQRVDTLSSLDLSPWIYSLPLMVLLTGVFMVLSQALIHQRRYRSVAERNLVSGGALVAAQVTFGVFSSTSGGLVGGFLVSRLVAILGMLRLVRRSLGSVPSIPTSRVWHRFRGFAGRFTIAGVLNALGGQLPILLMGLWFGASVAGYVGVAYRVLTVPAALIGVAVAQVLLGELAETWRTTGVLNTRLIKKAIARLLPIAALLAFVPALFGPRIAGFFLGNQWVAAGQAAQLLGLVAGISLIASPLAQVLVVTERSGAMLTIDTCRVALTLLLGWLAYSSGASPTWTLSAIAFGLALTYFGYLGAVWQAVRSTNRRAAVD